MKFASMNLRKKNLNSLIYENCQNLSNILNADFYSCNICIYSIKILFVSFTIFLPFYISVEKVIFSLKKCHDRGNSNMLLYFLKVKMSLWKKLIKDICSKLFVHLMEINWSFCLLSLYSRNGTLEINYCHKLL